MFAFALHRKKFIFRTLILIFSLFMVLYDQNLLLELLFYEIYFFKVYHILWFMLMMEMLQVCIPKLNNYVSCGKLFNKHYRGNPGSYEEEALLKSVKIFNLGALRSAIIWAIMLSIIGLLYVKGAFSKVTIHLLVVFFYFSDEFCINVWCPFRAWLIGNKCCNTCRIFNWGHFMMFSPYIFIPTFWTYSLLFMSLVILVQWEYMHYRYPERFSEVSNLNLLCSNCVKAQCRYMGANIEKTSQLSG